MAIASRKPAHKPQAAKLAVAKPSAAHHPRRPDFARERALQAQGVARVCGVDEAGRGPLAGPVVAAAVELEPGKVPHALSSLIDDSKRLSHARRERTLNGLVAGVAEGWARIGVGIAEPAEIERLNILWATLAAMERAVEALPGGDLYALVDGTRVPDGVSGEAMVKGDGRSLSIAAASIVAKTLRDRLCAHGAARFPLWSLDVHKGYPTAAHREALEARGPCPLHRRGFKGVGS